VEKVKILVFSDTHGVLDHAIWAINENSDADYVIHLGDFYGDFEHIKYLYLNNELNLIKKDVKFIGVIGNTDDRNEGDEEKIVEINNHKLLLTHGHKYGVKMRDDKIFYRGKELGVSAVLFGHTHVCRNVKFEDLLLLNPGSLSLPKGGRGPSYMVINIDKSTVSADLKFL